MWVALGTLGLALMGIGVFVWYQMQTMGGSTLAPTAGNPAPVARLPAKPAAPTAPPLRYEDALGELERLVQAMEAGQMPRQCVEGDRGETDYRRNQTLQARRSP